LLLLLLQLLVSFAVCVGLGRRAFAELWGGGPTRTLPRRLGLPLMNATAATTAVTSSDRCGTLFLFLFLFLLYFIFFFIF
jgi:hypothetical protein